MLDSYATIFSQRAASYCRAMERHPHARDAEFAMIVDPIDPAARTVVDMPSGAGWLRRHLPEGLAYIAVDPADIFMRHCPEDAAARRILSPLDRVPMADGSADAILSLAGLHHEPDLGAIFAEAHRLLRPGGQLIIADVAAGSGEDQFLNGYVHAHNPMGHEGVFLDDRTVPMLRNAGFGIAGDSRTATPWRLDDGSEAGSYCADLFGIEGQSPAQIVEALDSAVGVAEDEEGFVVHWGLRQLICRRH